MATQSGGASVTLGRLVKEARGATSDKDKIRNAHDRAYHFMLAIAGEFVAYFSGRAVMLTCTGRF
jgi:hypothetical protein